MAEPVKAIAELGEGGSQVSEGQLITVQTPSDDQQLIMVTFSGSDVATTAEGEHVYIDNDGSVAMPHDTSQAPSLIRADATTGASRDGATQTETVFGLEDLPTVTEIVRKTIAKTKKQEVEKLEQNVPHGPINGIYTCSICAKVYRNKVSWQNHLLSHNGDEVYMCGVCGQLFNIRMTLKAHLEIHVKEEKKMKRQRELMYGTSELKVGGVYMPGDIIPKDDDVVANKQLGLDSNIMASPHGQPDNSHSGNYVAATEEVVDEMETDLLVDTGSSPASSNNNAVSGAGGSRTTEAAEPDSNYIYACNICGKQYAVKEDCEQHLSVHTGGGAGGGGTSTDGTSSSTTSSSAAAPRTPPPSPPPRQEIEKNMGINPQSKFSAYIYACNICGKQYTNKSNCKRHMRIHTDDEKMYECEFCGKRFAQKYEVKMHSRIHTGEKPFSCAVCGKHFTERGNWRRHTQIHVRPQESSPYRCGICCKGFFHPEKLQVHLQIHSGQRPFICTVCGRKVKKIGDMYRHLRTHTGEKPYKCQVCGKGFAQNGNLKDHMKMHTGEKPHVCDLCGKDFARKVLLKEHIRHHHKGTTLQDLTEAALEEIERQEAAMETGDVEDNEEEPVVQEISAGNMPKILTSSSMAKTIVIGGTSNSAPDEAQLLQEEQEIELQCVHATLTEKELEAAHVLTVVQEGDQTVYAYKVNSESGNQIVVEDNSEIVINTTDDVTELVNVKSLDVKPMLTGTDGTELEVQNS